jgi:hypothetical protein
LYALHFFFRLHSFPFFLIPSKKKLKPLEEITCYGKVWLHIHERPSGRGLTCVLEVVIRRIVACKDDGAYKNIIRGNSAGNFNDNVTCQTAVLHEFSAGMNKAQHCAQPRLTIRHTITALCGPISTTSSAYT